MLWGNWAAAGLLSYLIWLNYSRFNAQGGSELKAFGISWPLLTSGFQFAYCHFPQLDDFAYTLVLGVALMLTLSLSMTLWQRHQATLKCLILGLLIGLFSTIVPQTILWLLLFPVVCYFMRCWSLRNACSVLTGTVFAVWVVYCAIFLAQGSESADQMIGSYRAIMLQEDYSILLQGLGLWHYIFMGITLLTLLFYSFSGFLLGAGQSIQTNFSIQLISMFSLVFLFLMAFDVHHFFINLGLLSVFLSLQLTIHQADVRSALHEWWIVLVILIYAALCIAPLMYSANFSL